VTPLILHASMLCVSSFMAPGCLSRLVPEGFAKTVVYECEAALRAAQVTEQLQTPCQYALPAVQASGTVPS